MGAFGILLWHTQRVLCGPLKMTPNDEVKTSVGVACANQRLRIQKELWARLEAVDREIEQLRAVVNSIHRRAPDA